MFFIFLFFFFFGGGYIKMSETTGLTYYPEETEI